VTVHLPLHRSLRQRILRIGFLLGIAITVLSFAAPMLGAAASVLRQIRGVQIKKGDRLAANLPDLAQARRRQPYQPAAPVFAAITDGCLDCSARPMDADSVFARFDPENRTGGDAVDLYSGNVKWTHPLAKLPGRSKLDVSLDLVYNSLVWTTSSDAAWYDADRGFPAPGFQLGLPRIQGPVRRTTDGPASYLLITPAGARIHLAETSQAHIFESTDGSLLQLVESGDARLILRTPEGTRSTFVASAGQWHCTRIEDRNGNYVTVSYDATGHPLRIEDTAGRLIDFLYSSAGNLSSVTEREPAGDKTLATFGYAAIDIDRIGSAAAARGAAPDRVVALTQLGLRDGSTYDFQYDRLGRVTSIDHRAPDGHPLSTVSYEFAAGTGGPATIRAWAEELNGGNALVTALAISREAGTGSAVLSDGSRLAETFGTSGWQRGLSLFRAEYDSAGRSRRTQTSWEQSGIGPEAIRAVKQAESVWTLDESRERIATTTAFTPQGLPQLSVHYRNDILVQRLRTTYVEAPEYRSRHILNLIARQEFESASGDKATTSYAYDTAGTIVDQPGILHHNSREFGPDFVQGRGLLSTITRSTRLATASSPAPPASTTFKYNTAGSLVEVRDSNGRSLATSYQDAYADGVNRNTFAYITHTSADGRESSSQFDFGTGARIRLETTEGEVQQFGYDAADRLVSRQNLTSGAGARRVFDESGTLITTFTRRPGATKEFTNYKVLDGAGLTRARAQGGTRRSSGYRASAIWRDARGRPVRSTPPVTVNDQWIAQHDSVVSGVEARQSALDRAADGLESAGRGLQGVLASTRAWLQADVHAQEYCDPDYYGYDSCIDDADNWFYGGDWGYDYYYDYSDFYDALTWYDGFYDEYFWDSIDWAFGQTDPQTNVDWQLWNSGYWDYIIDIQWTGKGYRGTMDPAVFDWLKNDPNFANGWLYGFHRDVGDNLADFRSYTGTFGDGSLQIVMDRYTGNFWIDVDRFNPYQDVVNFFGHTFVEVLPHLFRKLCFWC
jgi:YD repeat-containing protein